MALKDEKKSVDTMPSSTLLRRIRLGMPVTEKEYILKNISSLAKLSEEDNVLIRDINHEIYEIFSSSQDYPELLKLLIDLKVIDTLFANIAPAIKQNVDWIARELTQFTQLKDLYTCFVICAAKDNNIRTRSENRIGDIFTNNLFLDQCFRGDNPAIRELAQRWEKEKNPVAVAPQYAPTVFVQQQLAQQQLIQQYYFSQQQYQVQLLIQAGLWAPQFPQEQQPSTPTYPYRQQNRR